MWKKFEIYSIKKIVLVRKGRTFYATLYQEVFFCNPVGGGSLKNQNVSPPSKEVIKIGFTLVEFQSDDVVCQRLFFPSFSSFGVWLTPPSRPGHLLAIFRTKGVHSVRKKTKDNGLCAHPKTMGSNGFRYSRDGRNVGVSVRNVVWVGIPW